MRLKKGTLQRLSALTGISKPRLCDYTATRVRPRPNRARELESVCQKLGIDIPAHIWLLGSSSEIKGRLFLSEK
jgi:hypothetical protein